VARRASLACIVLVTPEVNQGSSQHAEMVILAWLELEYEKAKIADYGWAAR
jgi:hypothetical protein